MQIYNYIKVYIKNIYMLLSNDRDAQLQNSISSITNIY